MARPASDSTKDKMLSVPIEGDKIDTIKRAAEMEDRPMANYIRALIYQDLRAKGLMADGEGE